MSFAGDYTQETIDGYEAEEGYIVAFVNNLSRVNYLVQSRRGSLSSGGSLARATLFLTPRVARELFEAEWAFEDIDRRKVRILKVVRRAPVQLLDDQPLSVLDALADI